MRAKAAEAGSSISESLHQFSFIAKEMSEGVRAQAKSTGIAPVKVTLLPARGGHGGLLAPCWLAARVVKKIVQALVATGTP